MLEFAHISIISRDKRRIALTPTIVMGQAEFRSLYIIHLKFRGPALFWSLIMHEKQWHIISTRNWLIALRVIHDLEACNCICYFRSISYTSQTICLHMFCFPKWKKINNNNKKWLTKWEHCRLIHLVAFVRHTVIFIYMVFHGKYFVKPHD